MPRTNFHNENLQNIQGDVPSRGFLKRHETYYFFEILPKQEQKFNELLVTLADSKLLSSIKDVRAQRSAVMLAKETAEKNKESLPDEDIVNALIAFSMKGLEKISDGLPKDRRTILDIKKLYWSDPAFAYGMAADKRLNDPDQKEWDPLFRTGQIHGILKIAGNSKEIIDTRLKAIKDVLQHEQGVIGDIAGNSLPTQQNSRVDGQVRPQKGKEHYGFADGISQPLVIGLNTKEDIKENFTMIVGRERILVTEGFDMIQQKGLHPLQQTAHRPPWMNDGSFLVFRKLEQDVKAFQDLTEKYAKETKCRDAAHLGAKLMGRWPSGAPIVKFPDGENSNPKIAIHKDSNSRKSKTYDNDWNFDEKKIEFRCPLAAHIRKTHTRSGSRASSLTPIVRSGIPYGTEYSTNPDDKRGLLFACYQSSIENGFRFIQSLWSNNPKFPSKPEGFEEEPEKGYDPIIGQAPGNGKMFITINDRDDKPDGVRVEFGPLTTMKGGEYFFVPSFSMLRDVFGLRPGWEADVRA